MFFLRFVKLQIVLIFDIIYLLFLFDEKENLRGYFMKQSALVRYGAIGLMLFALFFGAGNLIYPAFLGVYSGSQFWLAIIGFCLTAVTLPLLGVVAIAYTGTEDAESLARPISKRFALLFSIALYLSIGPFFAIPRTGATSYSIGIEPIFGSSLWVKIAYAVVFFGLSYWLAIKPSKMVERIGKYITPALLFVLAILVVMSFLHPAGDFGIPYNAKPVMSESFADFPLVAGLIQGYGTMDALASLAFSIVVINSVKMFGVKDNRNIAKVTILSGVIAVVLLAVVYIFVARIGATSQSLFEFAGGQFTLNQQPIDGGHVLSQASLYYLGGIGRAVLAVIVFLACLTTSTGLISACAEYFNKLWPRLSHVTWATIFTLIALSLYFIGLSEIISWSVPVLYLLYPLTVVIIFLSLARNLFGNDARVYQMTVAFAGIAGLYDALSTLSAMTGLFVLPKFIVKFFTEVLPLGEFSMGWLPLATLGFVIGYVWHLVAKK